MRCNLQKPNRHRSGQSNRLQTRKDGSAVRCPPHLFRMTCLGQQDLARLRQDLGKSQGRIAQDPGCQAQADGAESESLTAGVGAGQEARGDGGIEAVLAEVSPPRLPPPSHPVPVSTTPSLSSAAASRPPLRTPGACSTVCRLLPGMPKAVMLLTTHPRHTGSRRVLPVPGHVIHGHGRCVVLVGQ